MRAPLVTLLTVTGFVADATALDSPEALAKALIERWAANSESAFAELYPFPSPRGIHTELVQNRVSRRTARAKVVRVDDSRATLVLGGVPALDNSATETIVGRAFSGVYEARKRNDTWQLSGQLPLEELGRILSHKLSVSLNPGSGIVVEDRIRGRIKSNHGFAARLNHAARIESVQSSCRDVPYFAAGGLLWLDLPAGDLDISLRYAIDVERELADNNSGRFLEEFGHLRGQYFWHPFFDFNSPGDQADFEIDLRIPKEYRAVTSLPQTEVVTEETRLIHGKSARMTYALTLAYDRSWKVDSRQFGDVRLELFLAPGFQPPAETIAKEFESIYSLLSSRFGAPGPEYFAIVQSRSKNGKSFQFASNQIIVAAASPLTVSRQGNEPQATLGHEIAHWWTEGSGPAANLLREGWATYVESLLLEREYGARTVDQFWSHHGSVYFNTTMARRHCWQTPTTAA